MAHLALIIGRRRNYHWNSFVSSGDALGFSALSSISLAFSESTPMQHPTLGNMSGFHAFSDIEPISS